MAREKITNPPGYLATQDLKERGWTPTLITRFLGEHDDTRPNGLKMGRRRLPPVKLYLEQRVLDIENEGRFLAAQAKAADARERAARLRESRQAQREALIQDTARQYIPSLQAPQPIRKGARKKAREPYLSDLAREQKRLEKMLEHTLGQITERESARLRELLVEQLDIALGSIYTWMNKEEKEATQKEVKSAARPSDWRTWNWDD